MRTKTFGLVLASWLLASGPYAQAQFKPAEIAQREQWEEFMKAADIVKSEPIGEGVTAPWRFYLKKGDIEKKAAWKNPDEKIGDIRDSWKHEIAAYRLDKLIGLNMVPPVIEREFNGKKGDLSLWADNTTSLLKMQDDNEKIPDQAVAQTERMKYVARLWDSLIANADRTQQNVLFTDDWRMILFDHSRAFQAGGKYSRRLMYGAKGIVKKDDGSPFLIQRVPRALFDKIKALNFEVIKQAVGPYLTDDQISAIIARIPLISAEIADMIKKNGEANVLY
jgi:hypothetical protein